MATPVPGFPQTFRIGDWTANTLDNKLRQDDTKVHLEPRTMQVLVALAQRPGEVVTKEALLETVWNGRFVTDDVLTGATFRCAIPASVTFVLARNNCRRPFSPFKCSRPASPTLVSTR